MPKAMIFTIQYIYMALYGLACLISHEHPVWLEAVHGTGRCEWLYANTCCSKVQTLCWQILI